MGCCSACKILFKPEGDSKGGDYIHGVIYYSLGQYSISPFLLKSLLERWNAATNTFLFQSGERTVTLLDMHRIMGLPLDGEFYGEFIPHYHEQDPSMPLYPNCLAQLFMRGMNYKWVVMYRCRNGVIIFTTGPGGPFHLDNTESSPVYKAAFLALWLCSYVVVRVLGILRHILISKIIKQIMLWVKMSNIMAA
jgi:hypothetical protein